MASSGNLGNENTICSSSESSSLTACHAPLLHQQEDVHGWHIISLLLVDVCVPESYVDCLSYFVLVLSMPHVHYHDMILVKGVTNPEVVRAQGRFLSAFNN